MATAMDGDLESALLAFMNVEPLAQIFLKAPGVPELLRKHGLID